MYIKGFSPSKLNVFDECQQKYRYKYIHYLPEEYNEGLSTEALQYGSYIHKVLEDGFEATSEDELWEHAHRLRESYQFTGREKDTEKCIKNFFKFNSKLTDTVSTEMKFKVDVLKDLEVNGIIDRVVLGGTGNLLVIDYKTSKREKSRRELYNDPQLMIYTAAIAKLYKCNIKDITVAHYYPITGHLVSIQYMPSHIASFLKRLDEKKWAIRKKKVNDFKPRINRFCDWCGYKNLCPLYGGTDKMLEEAISKKGSSK
jgi:putative RecB family exonuclease